MNLTIKAFIFTFTTGIIWGGVGVIFSTAIKKKFDFAFFMFLSYVFIFFSSLTFIPNYKIIISGGANSKIIELIFVMMTVAVMSNLGFLKMRDAMEYGHHGFSWAISQSAMILPFIFSLLFFKEKAEMQKITGVILVLISFVVFSLKKNTDKTKASLEKAGASENRLGWIFLSISAFILIGISQILSVIPSHWKGWTDNGALRITLLFGFSCFFWTVFFV